MWGLHLALLADSITSVWRDGEGGYMFLQSSGHCRRVITGTTCIGNSELKKVETSNGQAVACKQSLLDFAMEECLRMAHRLR